MESKKSTNTKRNSTKSTRCNSSKKNTRTNKSKSKNNNR